MAEQLDRVERGEVKRLFVTAPPRHWKSSLVAEKFVTYYLSRHPNESVILGSHTYSLAEGFSRNVRDTILFNPRYRELFGQVRVREDVASVSDWLLRTGHRSSCRAAGAGAAISGRGANLIVLDDPIADEKAAFSKTQRDALWLWYQNTLRERLEPGGAIVLVMSRWHADDLAGRLLRASKIGDGEQWEVLHMPAINGEGDALWPERWPLAELLKIKAAIGARAWAAKFAGNPREEGGQQLNSSLLVMEDPDDVPPMVQTCRRWDLAFSDRQGADWLAGAKLGRDARGHYWILHVKRIHGRWTQGKPEIFRISDTDGVDVAVLIEANGTQLGYYQDIQEDDRMQRRVVLPDKPEGTKEMRASLWGSRLEDGIIHCVRGPWNQDLFDEMDTFPNSDHDDMVDAVSGGYNYLASGVGGLAETVPQSREIGERGSDREDRRIVV